MALKLTTGLLGYSMKKEFLGESLYFRTSTNYSYEIYASEFTGNPTALKNLIYSEFANKYSGDIFVHSFEIPADPNSINDAVRIQKYKVDIDIKATCSGINDGQPELGTPYYTGVNAPFWNSWGVSLLDFREDFGFEQQENGNLSFLHDLSFQLITGTKQAALTVASGIFAVDKGTTFGIAAFLGGAVLADTSNYLDYYTEVYDQVRQTYHFTKRREILPLSGGQSVSNYTHSIDINENGVTDISEHGSFKGKLTFIQAKNDAASSITGAYNRCNTLYSTYAPILGGSTLPLFSNPTRTVRILNPNSLSAEYDISFTTNPNFRVNGLSIEELMEFEADEMNLATMRHKFNLVANKRVASSSIFFDQMKILTGTSPTTVNTYYSQLGSLYTANWPMKQTKMDLSWPNRNNRASISFEYSNNYKNFVTINGQNFNYIDVKVSNTLPVDIINEYKIINRPSKTSVLNYAYQTEKGQLTITLNAALGRNANEFFSGFRSNYSAQLIALYKYGIGIFMKQFNNMIPTAFTYYLSDVKYSMNQDGMLGLILTFTYTLKKYLL